MDPSRAFRVLLLVVGVFQSLSWQCSAADLAIRNKVLVVIEGSQGNRDWQQALEGVEMGIMKSSNTELKEQYKDVNFLFLELDEGGLFHHAGHLVVPWLQRHLELLQPRALLSLGGRAARIVENVTARLAESRRPGWHFKCIQTSCPDRGSGVMLRETCSVFRPRVEDVLTEMSKLKPAVRKVVLLSDGSEEAESLVLKFSEMSQFDAIKLCNNCTVETRRVSSAADVREAGPPAAEAASTFILLPSTEGINSSTAEIWAALRHSEAGAFAPREVVDLGGLASFTVHHGSAAEECSVVIAQKATLSRVRRYEAKTTGTYKIALNMERAEDLQDIEWYNGNLHHSGRELWQPVQMLWQMPSAISTSADTVQRTAAPKVLLVHSYGRSYRFQVAERHGFIQGLKVAGHSLNCPPSMHYCRGDLEVRSLYWKTRFWFTGEDDIRVTAEYTKEYIRRWRPDVVFFTDDDVLNHLVVPCSMPLTRGPNPTYDECAGTQYVGSGINADVRRIYRDACREYHSDGTCASGNFFIEDGSAQACSECHVGDEPACAQCYDLYDKARPVNITMHLELPDAAAVFRMMEQVKPGVRKVVFFSDTTITSRGWKEAIRRQYAIMQRDAFGPNITVDFDRDWHTLGSKDEFFQTLESYQSKPEYMVWIPSTLSFLPMDPHKRLDVWTAVLAMNTLGEVLQPGETDGALLSAAGHPDSMGRVCAQYASLILRGVAHAAMLPILSTALSKVFANVGRAMQLRSQDRGILEIPDSVLAHSDQIFTLCPPGQRLEEGSCVDCPEKTFKNVYGDARELCLVCATAEPGRTGLKTCETPEGDDTVWQVAIALVSAVVCVLGALTLRLRQRANAVWMIEESELHFGPGPVVVLGQGTFGYVVKAEYRGTSVAVKRVLPPDGQNKFDWEVRTMAFDRFTTCSSPSLDTTPGPTEIDVADLELGAGGEGRGLPMHQASGFKTLRRLPTAGKSDTVSRLFGSWNQHRRLRKDFINEMRVLSQLRHPCVTTVMGAVMSSSAEPALVMELMEHGSLYDMLHNDTVVIENELALPILCDVAQGLRFLHAAIPVIVHGDIKAQNVLLDSKFRAKVSDFGLSQKKQLGRCGTPFWMAPELLCGSQLTTSTDVYAFGILLNEVCTRQDPYLGEDPRKVLKAVVKDNKRPSVPETCCSNFEVLMRECWAQVPEIRPSAQELDERLRRMNNLSPTSPMAVLAPACRSLQKAYEEKAARTEGLLYDVFPRHVADQLRNGKKVEPESREVVTIFFSDIVGFTDISSTIEPGKISHMLDRLYTEFDHLSCQHGVFKVETIGDAYMAVSNLAEDQHEDHAKRIAMFALAAVEAANQTLVDVDDPSKGYINIRVGFHSGPVVANVVGTRNLRYCLFGDTVNTASRMESNSIKNHIHCSARAAQLIREQAPELRLIRRGTISVKGKGDMETFWVAKEPNPAIV